ncbi:HNH endonuclease [Flexibacterium corallicola]|uniref:HNH endonuclease n=1 Tax=Flexibacterium corallicola TaxID=3037259 RepID=UPI00286EE5F3|nr:HNH endonuclease [Pseudovibrio sp. M1P-2-3]
MECWSIFKKDRRSAEAQSYRKLYKTARWKRERLAHLAEQPLCVFCLARGILNDGSKDMFGSPQENLKRRYLVVDHITPHRGDVALFFDQPKQTLCPDDHDIVKQGLEVRGYSLEIGEDGWFIDPRHPANQ